MFVCFQQESFTLFKQRIKVPTKVQSTITLVLCEKMKCLMVNNHSFTFFHLLSLSETQK